MELKRRDFLKGLMGLAAVAAVGLPPIANEELFDEIEEFLDKGGEVSSHPVGPFGSIRIGSEWHALYGASLDIWHSPIEYPDFGSGFMRYEPGPRGWGLSCDLDTNLPSALFGGMQHEIELCVMGGGFAGTFTGKAYAIGSYPNIITGQKTMYQVDLKGVGPLIYAG